MKARPNEVAEIVDLSHEGRGVARDADGKAVFIDGALPGERVEWVRMKRSRNYDEGRLQRVLTPAPDRIEAQCPHFGVCGGCVLQHQSADRQLEFKQRQLLEALSRIGRATPASVLPPLRADAWNYRRRARLAARWVPKKQRTVVGFRERDTTYIADLKVCHVLQAPLDALLEPLSVLATALSVRDRLPQFEVAIADNAVALVVRVLKPLTPADHPLLEAFGREHRVQIYLQPGGYETVAPFGEATPLTYSLPQFEVTLEFQPTDFIQINAKLNALMVARAVELLAPQQGEEVLDLFCGLGNFSLPLARSAARVVGVEGDAALVSRARQNAARNGLAENTEFIAADLAADDVAQASWARRRYAKVLLDPPRAGALAVLPVIAASGAQRVVYVSCHPGSLARDTAVLVHEHGFRLEAAGVMDMFPHTTHVESIALFAR